MLCLVIRTSTASSATREPVAAIWRKTAPFAGRIKETQTRAFFSKYLPVSDFVRGLAVKGWDHAGKLARPQFS